MGIFVNPGNGAFQVALNSEIYVDKTALQQIRERDYPASIEEYTGKILLVAISYDKRRKKHHCLIEEHKK